MGRSENFGGCSDTDFLSVVSRSATMLSQVAVANAAAKPLWQPPRYYFRNKTAFAHTEN